MCSAKKSKLFTVLMCLFVAVLALVSCNTTKSPEATAKEEAEKNAQTVLGKLVWSDQDKTAITSGLTFITSNKNYPNVVINWETSEPDVISATGKVTRPKFDDARAEVIEGNNVVKVIVTAKVSSKYTYEENGVKVEKETAAVSKQFTFTVLALAEGIDSGSIKDVKDRAWNYIYVENKVEKKLVTNDKIRYNMMVTGKVIAKLNGDKKGFTIHDGTDGIYVYADNTKLNVGDTVEVIGEAYTYYGNIQIGKNVTVNKAADSGIVLPEAKEVTPSVWEEATKNIEAVIGRFGGALVNVKGTLTKKAPIAGHNEYTVVDPLTGDEAWLYYKGYNEEMAKVLAANEGKYVILSGVTYDRDSRINRNEFLWTGELTESEAPVVDDETKVNAALKQIVLKDSYDADFDLSTLGTWEVVSGTGITIAEHVAKVERTYKKQESVLRVTVTSGEVTKTKEFTIVIYGLPKEMTIAEALKAEDGTNAILTGEVINAGSWSDKYKNMNITLKDATGEISVFRCNVKVENGFKIKVTGEIGSHDGTKEIKQGAKIEVLDKPVDPTPTPERDPLVTEFKTTTFNEIKALAATEGFLSKEKYYAIGWIKTITYEKYGNMIIEDADGNTLDVYGSFSFDGTVKFGDMTVKPKVNDPVVLYGVINNYQGKIQIKNAWIVQVGKEVVKQSSQNIMDSISLGATFDADFDLPEKAAWAVKEGTGIVVEGLVAKVTRADADQKVVLTATVVYDGVTLTKDFTVIVKKIVKGLPAGQLPQNLTFTVKNKASGDAFLAENFADWTNEGKLGQTYENYLGFGRGGDSKVAIKTVPFSVTEAFKLTLVAKGNGNGVTSKLVVTLVDKDGVKVADAVMAGTTTTDLVPGSNVDTTFNLEFQFVEGKTIADASVLRIDFTKASGNIGLKSLTFTK